MINAIISLFVGCVFVGVLAYLLIDGETVRTVRLTKRAKKAYHKYGNNKLETQVQEIENKLQNK